jgi:hypothetical protein
MALFLNTYQMEPILVKPGNPCLRNLDSFLQDINEGESYLPTPNRPKVQGKFNQSSMISEVATLNVVKHFEEDRTKRPGGSQCCRIMWCEDYKVHMRIYMIIKQYNSLRTLSLVGQPNKSQVFGQWACHTSNIWGYFFTAII